MLQVSMIQQNTHDRMNKYGTMQDALIFVEKQTRDYRRINRNKNKNYKIPEPDPNKNRTKMQVLRYAEKKLYTNVQPENKNVGTAERSTNQKGIHVRRTRNRNIERKQLFSDKFGYHKNSEESIPLIWEFKKIK